MTVRQDRFGNVVQASRPSLGQVLAIGVGANTSAPFAINQDRPLRDSEGNSQPTNQQNQTRHVRVVCTAPAWISFGTSPTAIRQDSASMFMPAGLPEYFWVQLGERLSVIQDATGGFCYITELTN